MDYKRITKEIIKGVGGRRNIKSINYCSLRLRLQLKDESKIDFEYLNTIDGVTAAFMRGEDLQVFPRKDMDTQKVFEGFTSSFLWKKLTGHFI